MYIKVDNSHCLNEFYSFIMSMYIVQYLLIYSIIGIHCRCINNFLS